MALFTYDIAFAVDWRGPRIACIVAERSCEETLRPSVVA